MALEITKYTAENSKGTLLFCLLYFIILLCVRLDPVQL